MNTNMFYETAAEQNFFYVNLKLLYYINGKLQSWLADSVL